MARDFSKNVANYMTWGAGGIAAKINGAAIISVGIWVQLDTMDVSANQNRFLSINISSNTSGLVLATDGASHLRAGARSVNADGFQTKDTTTTIPTGGVKWTHIGAEFNIAADTITPYINGLPENGGSVTFANAVWTNDVAGHTTDQDAIGANFQLAPPPGVTTTQVDGRICDVVIYNQRIGDAGFKELAWKYTDPRLIARPSFYAPLRGDHPIEVDIVSLLQGTITGSVPPGNDPPGFLHRRHLR